MKNIMVAFLILFGVEIANGQGLPVNVPSAVSSKFKGDYPAIDPKWSNNGGTYSAEYLDEASGLRRMLTYDKSGVLMRTDRELNGTNYPPVIDDYCHKNFPNENYRIWSSEDQSGLMSYFCPRKGHKTLWFDKDGKYLSGK